MAETETSEHFKPNYNIGIILGEPSGAMQLASELPFTFLAPFP